VAGACDANTGVCSNPAKADGASCDDGNPLTKADICTAGACSGVPLCTGVVCAALDECHVAGACDANTGVCSNPVEVDGASCDDGDALTKNDVCTAGACGGVPLCSDVICVALDQCHDAGACDPASGECDNPAKADGASCDDGDALTKNDVCTAGACAGVSLCADVTCTALDDCHEIGTCDPATGECDDPAKADGSDCAGGTCEGGACQAGTGGSGGSGAGGGAGAGGAVTGTGGATTGTSSTGAGGNDTGTGAGGATGATSTGSGQPNAGSDGGCGCSVAGAPEESSRVPQGLGVVLVGLAVALRRRRAAARAA
jgi:MYXO-CTERM domain-containing protein